MNPPSVKTVPEMDAAKTAFVATISHELKTPLTSISLSLKLLEDARVGSLNPEQQSLLGNIRTETARLASLVTELLNLAQLENGSIPLQPVSVPVPMLLTQAAEILRFQALQKQVHLHIQLPETEMLNIKADAEKTVWILTNLVGNAVRYAPQGSVITLSANDEGSAIRLNVADKGPGIPPEYQARIFEKFFRVPADFDKPFLGGTGLGLAISREFVEAQGGRIWLESTPGEGSTFSFILPKG